MFRRQLKKLSKSPHLTINKCVRLLFTEESLGIKTFEKWSSERRGLLKLAQNPAQLMLPSSGLVPNLEKPILSDDFKDALAIADSAEKVDPEKLFNLASSYCKQMQEWYIPTSAFAVLMMRLIHRKNLPDLAVKLILDDHTNPMFDQLACYQICLDVLLKCQKYKQVIELWHNFQENSGISSKMKYPRSIVIGVYTAFFEQNTLESCDQALALYKQMRQTNYSMPRRATVILAALCWRKNKPEMAYEFLSTINCDEFVLGRSLKVLLAITLRRWSDIFRIFSKMIFNEFTTDCSEDFEISVEVVKLIEKVLETEGNQILKAKLLEQIRLLKMGGHVIDRSIDQLLRSPIALAPLVQTENEMDQIDQKENRGETDVELLPAPDFVDQKLQLTSYCNDTSDLESVDKFRASEKKAKRKERFVRAIADQVVKNGPFL